MNFYMIAVLLSIIAAASSTEVRKCPGSKARKLESTEVKVSKCPKNNCVLKRNTKAHIQMKFQPSRDFETLKQSIKGIILDVPLPFPGFDGSPACDYIYDSTGETKVGCPLKANEIYTYKNSFDILSIYPTVNLIVHWGLTDGKEDAACFELPARIK